MEIRAGCPGGPVLLKVDLGLCRSLSSVATKPYSRAAVWKKEVGILRTKLKTLF